MDTNKPLNSIGDFAIEIRNALRSGYRFVPLVGAGVSAPSGIPVVAQMTSYIAHCIRKGLGLDSFMVVGGKLQLKPGSDQSAQSVVWNPRSTKWPSVSELTKEADKELKQLLKVCEDFGTSAKGSDDRNDGEKEDRDALGLLASWVYQEAYGALADWRSSLIFLSRLEPTEVVNSDSESLPKRSHDGTPKKNRARPNVRLGAPESSVVDTFFQHLTAGREPCLGHRMLASLSEVLRFDLILTTNFDSLIEEAFEQSEQRFHAIDVTLGSSLPPVVEEAGVVPIIKLHGSRLGLRADYSLDAPVEQKDKDRFISYLVNAGTQLEYRDEHMRDLAKSEAVALLVLGVSGSDRRMTELIAYALSQLPRFNVYWIYYSAKDEAKITSEILSRPDVREAKGKITLVKASDPGRALLEVYQSCTSSIPASGVSLPVAWNLPMPPIIPQLGSHQEANDEFAEAKERTVELKKIIVETARFPFSVIDCVAMPLGGQDDKQRKKHALGLQTVASRVFQSRDWENAEKCRLLWLELDDFADLSEVFLKLLISIATALGHKRHVPTLDLKLFQPSQVKGKDDNAALLEQFAHEFATQIRALNPHPDDRWLIFVNALEPLNGGYGKQRDSKNEEVNALAFWTVLSELAGDGLGNSYADDSNHGPITFILLRDADHLAPPATSSFKFKPGQNEPLRLNKPCTTFNRQDVVDQARRWADNDPERWVFLKLLGAFKLVRHKAGLLKTTRRMFVKLALRKMEFGHLELDQWLEELDKRDVIRFKEGGFVWSSVEVRDQLERLANQMIMLADKEGTTSDTRLAVSCETFSPLYCLLQSDVSIAQWYERLFFCSGDPLAVFIAIEHYLRGLFINHERSESSQSQQGTNEEKIGVLASSDRLKKSEAFWSAAIAGIRHSIVLARNARSLVERKISEPLTVRHVDRLVEFINGIQEATVDQSGNILEDKLCVAAKLGKDWGAALGNLRGSSLFRVGGRR